MLPRWVLALHQAGNCRRCLGQFCVGFNAACGDGLDNTVAQVFVKKSKSEGIECFARRRNLGQYVDAIRVGFDHPLDPADLILDSAQPFELCLFGV